MARLIALLAMIACGSVGAKADPVLKLMHGTWRGEGHVLMLDTQRMQANIDIEKPFQRDPLVIRNIAGRMVIFQINARRFIGLFEGRDLHLTGDGVQGSATLRRPSARR